jgi:hypothetical protein
MPSPQPSHDSNIDFLFHTRDLSRTASGYSDVAPNLALSSLLKAKRRLEAARQGSYLNVDIVRLGTLLALRRHLEKISATHGAGFYDFV